MSDDTEEVGQLKPENPSEIILEELQDALPSVFSEGELNIEKLKGILGDEIEAPQSERYEFTWAGKSEAIQEQKKPATQTMAVFR